MQGDELAEAVERDTLAALRRRERQQTLVAELGRAALLGASIDEFRERAVAAAADGLGVERAALLEPADGVLLCRSSVGWPEEELRPVPVTGPSHVGETFRVQEPLVVGDYASDARYPGSLYLVELGLASGAAVPVRGEEEPVGVLVAHSSAREAFGNDEVVFLRSIANLFAIVVAHARAEESRRRSEKGLAFLAEAGHILASSLDYDSTLSTLASLVVPRLADWFIVDLAEPDGMFRRVAVAGALDDKRELLEQLAREYTATVEGPSPASRAVTTGTTVRFSGFSPETLRTTTKDERHFELLSRLDPHAAIAVPLVGRERVLGALTFAWSESGRHYDDADVHLAEELARRATAAIENARLYRSESLARALAEEAQRRLSFLADAGELLSASLDYEQTLTQLAELAVPRFADWCTIVMVGAGGALERLIVVHDDPDKRRWAEAFAAQRPLDPDDPSGAPLVIRTGKPMFVREITEEMLSSAAGDENQLEILRALDLRSSIVVPLVVRGQTIGALTLATTTARSPYTDADLELARELARRAAQAVENARLYQSAEQGARAAEALDYVADAVVLLDAAGRVRYWNPSASHLTGIPEPDALGRMVGDLIPSWPQLAERVQEHAPVTIPVLLSEEERWLSVTRVGFGQGSVFTLRDVGRERAIEQARSDLVATASHELRTPLAAIYGAARTLLRDDIDLGEAERAAFLGVIESEGERLARVIDQILLAGQLDDGRVRLARDSCDLAELAVSVIEATRHAYPDGHRIHLHASSSLPPVHCDRDRFRQVLGNLLENAVKYSPKGGSVDVRLRGGPDDTIVLEVEDEGIGIPASEQERIFEKFHRLDPGQTAGIGGTGLGLYITRELVTRMGGRILVTSRTGAGSTFSVVLPTDGAG